MKIQFIGVGSAFAIENYNSNAVLTFDNGGKMLIDAGSDLKRSLKESGISLDSISVVYISHLHADHVGGLEFLAFSTYFNKARKNKIKLIIHSSMVDTLWGMLKPGIGISDKVCELKDYFDVYSVDKTFICNNCEFETVKTVHVSAGQDSMYSYGLFFNGTYITTDTQFRPDISTPYYLKSKNIFQDCETAKFKSGVHAHYDELVDLPGDIKKKMKLYHFQDGEKKDCLADGFSGWVKQNEEYQI